MIKAIFNDLRTGASNIYGTCAVPFFAVSARTGGVPELEEDSKLLRTVGANIRRLRMKQDMTQQELSERADVDIRTVQRVEAAKIDVLLRTLNRLRRGLRCAWEDIL